MQARVLFKDAVCCGRPPGLLFCSSYSPGYCKTFLKPGTEPSLQYPVFDLLHGSALEGNAATVRQVNNRSIVSDSI
jgi:hypothetical protein